MSYKEWCSYEESVEADTCSNCGKGVSDCDCSAQIELATTKQVFIERWNDEISQLHRLGSSIKNVETFNELLDLQEKLEILGTKVAIECFGE